MTCRSCGATIAEKAIVCYRCGTATAEPVRRTPAPAPGASRVRWMVPGVMAVVLGAVAWGLPVESAANRPAEIGAAASAVLAAWHGLRRSRR